MMRATVATDVEETLRKLERAGCPQRWLRQVRKAHHAPVRIAIGGPVKAGKTTLVRALLALLTDSEELRDRLRHLPIDVIAATACPVVFGHSDKDWCVLRYGDSTSPPGDWDLLRKVRIPEGGQATGWVPPDWAEVFLPVPDLKAFQICDTAGIGNLGDEFPVAQWKRVIEWADVVCWLNANVLQREEEPFLQTAAEEGCAIWLFRTQLDRQKWATTEDLATVEAAGTWKAVLPDLDRTVKQWEESMPGLQIERPVDGLQALLLENAMAERGTILAEALQFLQEGDNAEKASKWRSDFSVPKEWRGRGFTLSTWRFILARGLHKQSEEPTVQTLATESGVPRFLSRVRELAHPESRARWLNTSWEAAMRETGNLLLGRQFHYRPNEHWDDIVRRIKEKAPRTKSREQFESLREIVRSHLRSAVSNDPALASAWDAWEELPIPDHVREHVRQGQVDSGFPVRPAGRPEFLTLTVTTSNDELDDDASGQPRSDGSTSLRHAIAVANSTYYPVRIEFSPQVCPPGKPTELVLKAPLVVSAPSVEVVASGPVTLIGTGPGVVLDVRGMDVSIQGFRVRATDGAGVAFTSTMGLLEMIRCTFGLTCKESPGCVWLSDCSLLAMPPRNSIPGLHILMENCELPPSVQPPISPVSDPPLGPTCTSSRMIVAPPHLPPKVVGDPAAPAPLERLKRLIAGLKSLWEPHVVKQLSLSELLDFFSRHLPVSATSGAIMREPSGEGSIVITQVFLDSDKQLVCDSAGRPRGRRLIVRSPNQDILDEFGTTDLIVVE